MLWKTVHLQNAKLLKLKVWEENWNENNLKISLYQWLLKKLWTTLLKVFLMETRAIVLTPKTSFYLTLIVQDILRKWTDLFKLMLQIQTKAYSGNSNLIYRNYNEDRVSIILNITKPAFKNIEDWPTCSFFAVYDGHGGASCADFLRDNLH